MHIDDVLREIEGDNAFIVVEKDGYTAIDYVYVAPTTFPFELQMTAKGALLSHHAQMRRECRGLLFDENGKLIRRPYHKFFNYGEEEQTSPDILANSLEYPHVILDKLDGTMIAPFKLGDEIIWGTRLGDTQAAKQAQNFVNRNYNDFARKIIAMGCTPIFEWISPEQRIVLKYDEPNLVLTAIRHMTTGLYFAYEDVQHEAQFFDIPVVDFFSPQSKYSIEDLVENFYNCEDEGAVIVFDTGFRFKIKAREYVKAHKALEKVKTNEKLLELILDDQLDDVKPHLDPEIRERVEKFARNFYMRVANITEATELYVNEAKKLSLTRKEFAQESSQFDKLTQSLCFSLWDNKGEASELVLDKVRKMGYKKLSESWLKGIVE